MRHLSLSRNSLSLILANCGVELMLIGHGTRV